MKMPLLALAVILATAAPLAHAQQLPAVTAQDLNKKKISWPRDFTGDRTVLIIAFGRNQQVFIDGWVAGLQLKKPGAAPWYEVPLINNPGSFVRSFIDSGMRRGIPSVEDRAHVVTLYVKKKQFMQTLGLPDENVHVLVVDKTGKVLSRVTGTYSAEAATPTLAALKL
jgi:hypothetical protein